MGTMRETKWVRSDEGWIAGVCEGIGRSFDIPPGLIRLIWVVSILFFGFGLLAYFVAMFTFPVRGREHKAMEPKVLGVCLRLAQKFEMDVGLVRFLAVLILLSSFGTTIIGYVILHFVVPYEGESNLTNMGGES